MGSLPPGGGFRPALLWLPLLAPPTEGLVGGDDQARAFVGGGRELEEQVRSLRFERDVPDLIDLYRHRHRSMRWASPRWTTPAPNYCSASSPRPMDVGPWRSPRIGHSRLGPLPAPTHHRRQPPGPAPAPRHHRGHQRRVLPDARGPNHPRRTPEQELINRKGWGLLVGHQRGLLVGH